VDPGGAEDAYSRVCRASTAKGAEHVRVARRQDPLSDRPFDKLRVTGVPPHPLPPGERVLSDGLHQFRNRLCRIGSGEHR